MYFDRIVIVVPDLVAALAAYRALLGVPLPAPGAGERRAWIALPNTVLELQQRDVPNAFIAGLVFADPATGVPEHPLQNELGLELALGDGCETGEFRASAPAGQCHELSVDHLVLRSADAQACIALFRDRLGIRLALDKSVPEWGGRMLFFRAGKLTLEVIAGGDTDAGHALWGIAYQCEDAMALADRLRDTGVAVSDVREGRKPGTLVATLKSHQLGIPTLLIQQGRVLSA